MKKKVLIPILVVAILVIAAFIIFLSYRSFDTTLEFTFRDAVSKDFVWNATATMQGRVIRSFYQSDQGTRSYTFSHLKPGETELTIDAPSYEKVTVPVKLKRGSNSIEEPIELKGYEIPDLDHWIIFEEPAGNDLLLELHPVGTDGKAVTNHPCVDLWIGALVSEQIKNGVLTSAPQETGSERGKSLFMGSISWEFDSAPETIFRYTARIPGRQIAETKAQYWVIDYIVLVPDARKISSDEVDALMEEVVGASLASAGTGSGDESNGGASEAGAGRGAIERILTRLEEEEDRLDYYFFTNWNVERP